MSGWDSVLAIALAVAVPVEAAVTLRRDRLKLLRAVPVDRRAFFLWTLIVMWTSAALGLGLSILTGASLAEIGLSAGRAGWPALIVWVISISLSLAVVLQWAGVCLSGRVRSRLQEHVDQIGPLDRFLPRTPAEQRLFIWVGLSAGLTEEILFRGVLIWALASVMPVGLAAVFSLILFVALHRYQGQVGMSRVAGMGALLTLIVLVSGSLWPAILLHGCVDVFNGLILWRLRGAQPRI